MWPERGEALSRTIEAEAALTDIYAEALNQWVVQVQPLAVPSLTAASTLPPDPDAVSQDAGRWDQQTGLILAGLSSLWSLALVETLLELEIDLPELGGGARPEVPEVVTRAIANTSAVRPREVREAVARVDADPNLRQAREEFLEAERQFVDSTPALLHDKVAMAVRDLAAKPGERPAPTTTVVITRQREAAVAVLTPGSAEVREVARHQGYQAAGVQNAAVIEAARQSEDELEKTWIATLDGKTRDTHFAADGQRTPLAGTFTVGNASLRYPGDPTGPASEVRNCRCRVGVLAPDEEIPDEVDRHTERLNGRDSVAVNRKGSQRDEIERRADKGVVRARDDEDGVGRTASAAPSEQEYDMTGPKAPTTGPATATLEESAAETFRTFTDQPIAFVGIETSDGRMLAADIDLSFRTFPLPVMWCKQSTGGHYDSFTVGVIEAGRIEGDTVLGSGYMLNGGEADEACEQLGHTATRPSVDLASVEWKLTDEDGKEITEEEWWDLPIDAKVIQTITAAELIGTTLVATPAFGDTMLQLNAERETRDIALVASAAESFQPRVYPAALFGDPGLGEPTELQIDAATGRVFGHLACFGQCHRSVQSQCVIAPRSPSGYSMFHTSPSVRLDDGTSLPVGRLTVGTGHAPDSLSGGPAMAHYDNTGNAWALVRAGEDSFGIWVSGVIAPWATPEQVEMALHSPLSGDWRDFGQGLDLIAGLNVNTPGFVVRGRDGANGRPAALVAAIGPAPSNGASQTALSAKAIGDIVEAAVLRANQAARRAVEAEALLAAAQEKVGTPPPPKTPNDEIAELLAGAEL